MKFLKELGKIQLNQVSISLKIEPNKWIQTFVNDP